jgi:hypothetical protein
MAYLWHSKTGVDNLDKALKHIITVTWGSAAVPSAFQIIAVSMYNSESVRLFRYNKRHQAKDRLGVPQGEGRHLVLFFLLMTGKFYTLGVMRSLNSRPELRGRMTSDDIGRTSLSDWQWDDEHRHSDTRRSSEVRLIYT